MFITRKPGFNPIILKNENIISEVFEVFRDANEK